jgi:hypothetical protein
MTNRKPGRPPTAGRDAIERAQKLIIEATDINELRAAQALLLPLLGLTLDQTAEAIGKSKFWASRARNALLAGEPPPTTHGGRRRAMMPVDAEVALLQQAIRNAFDRFDPSMLGRSRVRVALRALLDERSGGSVSESTVTSFLNRVAPKLTPQVSGLPISEVMEALEGYWAADRRLMRKVERLEQP